MKSNSAYSVVVPVYNEAESLTPLYEELVSVFEEMGGSFEIIFVNDGSRDTSQHIIDELYSKDKKHVKAIQLRNNFGKAAALQAGFQMASGDIVITLDADLQDDPKEIPMFVKKFEEGYDMVSGWKQERKDSLIKNVTSKFFNAVTNKISKVKLHDFNCGFKAYKLEVVKGLNLYGELHRYIPVIVASQGYAVAEIPVQHRKRVFGKTKYGTLRFIHGFLDLITVLFITRFRARPLHLFGYVGLIFFSLGFAFGIYLVGVKFIGHKSIGDRPLLILATMLMIMGVQIGVTGILSEHITSMIHKTDTQYVIRKKLGEEDHGNN